MPVFIWEMVGRWRFVAGRGRGRDVVVRAGKLKGRVSPAVRQARYGT